MNPGGGFDQISIPAENRSGTSHLGRNARRVRPPSRQWVLQQVMGDLFRPCSLAHVSDDRRNSPDVRGHSKPSRDVYVSWTSRRARPKQYQLSKMERGRLAHIVSSHRRHQPPTRISFPAISQCLIGRRRTTKNNVVRGDNNYGTAITLCQLPSSTTGRSGHPKAYWQRFPRGSVGRFWHLGASASIIAARYFSIRVTCQTS